MSARTRRFDPRTRRLALADRCRTVGRVLAGAVAIAFLSLWHRLTSSVTGGSAGTADRNGDPEDATVVEHELGWYRYLKAFDAHHGPGGDADRPVDAGSALRGLGVWMDTRFLRGYTLGNEVYVCTNAPRVLRVHQAGHAPAFGSAFPTLVRSRRADGGLADAPLWTLDVMLPGDFPHTLLRFRDSRGFTGAYREWLSDGRIVRTPA